MKNFNTLRIKLNYYSNFRICLKSKKHLVFCKKFLSFLYLFNFIFLKNFNFEKNKIFFYTSFFFKKKKQRLFVILRAPYKNKLSRNQLTISRYFYNFNLYFCLNKNIKINSLKNFFYFFNSLRSFFYFFESNICFLHSYKIFFNFFLKCFN